MKNLLSLGIVVVGLFLSLGCGGDGPDPADAEAKNKQLYEDPDYQKQMMGEMSGGGDKSKP